MTSYFSGRSILHRRERTRTHFLRCQGAPLTSLRERVQRGSILQLAHNVVVLQQNTAPILDDDGRLGPGQGGTAGLASACHVSGDLPGDS